MVEDYDDGHVDGDVDESSMMMTMRRIMMTMMVMKMRRTIMTTQGDAEKKTFFISNLGCTSLRNTEGSETPDQ